MADKPFRERIEDALAAGLPMPEFPDVSPMAGLAMAQHECVTEWVKAGFTRQEALYMVISTFCGNPGFAPPSEGQG